MTYIDYSVTGHQLAKIEGGLQLTKKRKFSDIKDNPLGSVKTLLFWNDLQKQVETQVVNMQPTLLMGDYGTGLSIIVMSSSRIISLEGKTLILEAAAKTLSEKEDTEVVFIMALGELVIAAEM